MKFLSFSMMLLSLLVFQSCVSVKSGNSVFWVNAYKMQAMGVGPMEVYQIYRGDDLKNAKWENFYAPINGFQFKQGVLQKIEVKETHLDPKDVPADASSIRYDLIKVLKTQKTDE
ncbi:MAG: DUF4377 domain-containing protein [Chryseobacterium sp.]